MLLNIFLKSSSFSNDKARLVTVDYVSTKILTFVGRPLHLPVNKDGLK